MIVYCIVALFIEYDFVNHVVTQGKVVSTQENTLTVDFKNAIIEGEYDLELNSPTTKIVSKKDCKVVEK